MDEDICEMKSYNFPFCNSRNFSHTFMAAKVIWLCQLFYPPPSCSYWHAPMWSWVFLAILVFPLELLLLR